MTISIHFVVDNCPPEQLDRGLLYLQRVKPPTVDIAAGAELIKGMQFAERVRRDVPGIKIFWRNLEIEDTGILLKKGAAFVYQQKVAPHLAWFKRNEIVFMPDNETSGDDDTIRRYVDEQVEIARLLHADGLRGAFCRFSSGTIDDGGKGSNQYPLLKPIFAALLPGDYVSPNEYSPSPGYAKGGGGHLRRYHEMWIAAGRELPTVIGEAGVAMNYDPGKGYIDAGMSDEGYGQQMLDEEIWYENGKIDRHIYLIGGFTHAGYRLRAGVLKYWEDHYAKQPPIVILPPAPAVTWIMATAKLKLNVEHVNLRAAPDVTSADLGDIHGFDPIEYDSTGVKNGWWHVRYFETEGYVSAQYFEPVKDEPPPRLPYVPVPTGIDGGQTVTISGLIGYVLQAAPTNDRLQKVGLLTDGEQVTLYRSTREVADGLTWYWTVRTSTPLGESSYGWIAYNLPPPPPAALREYVIKVVITATEEQTAQIAAGAVNLIDFLATFSDVWKSVKPKIVIEDLSQVRQGAST